jgi:hypothetical protein
MLFGSLLAPPLTPALVNVGLVVCLIQCAVSATANVGIVDAEAAALEMAAVVILACLYVAASAGVLGSVLVVPLAEEVSVEVLLVDKGLAA